MTEGEIEQSQWNGFKLMLDNIDKNVVPRYFIHFYSIHYNNNYRYRRIDNPTTSLHNCFVYAVKDRVDLSGFSDDYNQFLKKPTSELQLDVLSPSSSDKQALTQNFAILASRVLIEEMPYFKETLEDVIQKHLEHVYSSEMATKSEVVSIILIVNLCMKTIKI
jgi:L1 cell adhesion molecule like protein